MPIPFRQERQVKAVREVTASLLAGVSSSHVPFSSVLEDSIAVKIAAK